MFVKNKFFSGSKVPWYRPIFWLMYCLGVCVLFVEFDIDLSIPIAVPSILGTAISLFLGFRTNSAYQRWWEARKVWGEIINNSRTLARQVLLFGNEKNSNSKRKAIIRRQIGWSWTFANTLRGLDPLPELKKHVSKEEFDQLNGTKHLPNSMLFNQEKQLKEILESGDMDDFYFRKIDSTLKELCDSMGKAERIKKTVFPTQYSLFTIIFINMFLFMLPLGMIKELGYFAIPIQVAVGFTFGMIQNIVESMQDPFENKPNDIPVSSISRSIEINLLEMIGEDKLPEPIQAKNGVLM